MFNRKTIVNSIIMPLIVIIVGTLLVTLLLDFIRSKSPHLVYSKEHSQFVGDNANQAIDSISIENTGRESAKNVVVTVSFPKAKISEFASNFDPSNDPDEKVEDGKYKAKISSLNPKEKIDVSFLTEPLDESMSGSPIVSLRAEGVAGEELSEGSYYILIVTGIFIVSILLIIKAFFYRKKLTFDNKKSLEIVSAIYGTYKGGFDITKKLQTMIVNNKLTTKANNDIAGDPHKNEKKKLSIIYKTLDGLNIGFFDEEEELILPLGQDSQQKIKKTGSQQNSGTDLLESN